VRRGFLPIVHDLTLRSWTWTSPADPGAAPTLRSASGTLGSRSRPWKIPP